MKVFLGDNLDSHISAKVLKVCRENNIRFACFPPNETDILQPLDVTFFAPMKGAWRRMLDDYKIDSPKETTARKDKFSQLLKLLLEGLAANGKANLKIGFVKRLSRSSTSKTINFPSNKLHKRLWTMSAKFCLKSWKPGDLTNLQGISLINVLASHLGKALRMQKIQGVSLT